MASYTPEDLFYALEEYVGMKGSEIQQTSQIVAGLKPGKMPTLAEVAAMYNGCFLVDRLYTVCSFMKDLTSQAKIDDDRLDQLEAMLSLLNEMKPAIDAIIKQGGFDNDK